MAHEIKQSLSAVSMLAKLAIDNLRETAAQEQTKNMKDMLQKIKPKPSNVNKS